MIKQIKGSFKYTKEQEAFIASLMPLKGHEWDKPAKGYKKRSKESIRRNKGVSNLKTHIRNKLIVSHKQTYGKSSAIHCAYCGLSLDVTSNDEIEHFSPKSARRTPYWMFLQENLLLACHLCNGPKRKGNKGVLLKKRKDYNECEFNIVHPKLDDPDEHFAYLDKNKLIICKAKCSDQGKLSVKWFKLDKNPKTQARINEFLGKSITVSVHNGAVNFDLSFMKKHFS